MKTVEEINNAIRQLPRKERVKISDGDTTFKELYEINIKTYFELCRMKVERAASHSPGGCGGSGM